MTATPGPSLNLVMVDVLHDILWWILPNDVVLTLAAIITMSGLIICLMFDCVASKEQPAYVPKESRRRKSCLSIVLFDALEQCATTIAERINNKKVRRRSHPTKLHYSGHRPKRKKGKPVPNATLTGMTMTWSNE